MLLDKLEAIKNRFEDVEREISSPAAMSDMKRFAQLNREYKELQVIVAKYAMYKDVVSNLEHARELVSTEKDDEFRDMAKLEYDELSATSEKMEEEIKLLLIPKDPEDQKNAIVEIRAGTGGDEASIFAGELYRMYQKFCERRGLKTELVDFTDGTSGGFKEIIFNVSGDSAYGIMKYESGVHRVQRVPQTETQGRVHTSAATVAVLPEADEFDIDVKANDVRKDLFCSSGPGGQSVNTTYSAVRLTHIPTGIVAQCQDQKSQIKNFEKAMTVLRSRIYELEYNKVMEERARQRKTMVSSGDRSAKIRTYNYPQSRITDHRIGLTMYNLQAFIDGDIGEMIGALQVAENAERLKEGMI
ncbi:MAG: peptide chain release factor 1 [Bacteroidetes bacterium]|nr:peptide chain release factor 1 [Bacteroidota bacterium]MBK8363433.1 peptide chain release factor 1 [Bacteroidota bacterium]MBK9414797.1 peptide chain release factor 1 [Bacteroidota bacterium]